MEGKSAKKKKTVRRRGEEEELACFLVYSPNPDGCCFHFRCELRGCGAQSSEPTVVKQQQLAANLAQTKHPSEPLLLMEVYLPASRLRALILHSLLAASHRGSHGDSGPSFFCLWLRHFCCPDAQVLGFHLYNEKKTKTKPAL